jgi:DNA-binding NtrC family response regulator
MAKIKISNEAQEKLLKYPYPGNVRELKSVIDLAAVMSDGVELQAKDIAFNNMVSENMFLLKEMTLQEYNYHIIRNYLTKYNDNVMEVAIRLDIGKSSIYRYLKEMEQAGI